MGIFLLFHKQHDLFDFISVYSHFKVAAIIPALMMTLVIKVVIFVLYGFVVATLGAPVLSFNMGVSYMFH
jgi:hypothetical protein